MSHPDYGRKDATGECWTCGGRGTAPNGWGEIGPCPGCSTTRRDAYEEIRRLNERKR